MSTTAMWLLLAVVVIVIVFASVLYKRTFTVHELALTGVMAALSLVAYLFFRVPFYGGSSFHLGNTFTALTALLLDGVSGGLAGAIGLALADILAGDPGYAVTTFVLKFLIGITCGAVAHKVFKLRDLDRHSSGYLVKVIVAAGSGLLLNVFTDPFLGYFRNVYIFGQEYTVAQALTKIAGGVTFVNSVASTVCVVLLYLALRPALDRAGLLPKGVPKLDKETGRYLYGFQTMGNVRVKGNVLTNLKNSFYEVRYWIYTTIQSLKMLVTRQVSPNELSGPVGIVKSIGDTYQQSVKNDGYYYALLNMLNWTILLSANLCVMNLLPLPALDGGRLLFLIIEAIRRKRIDPNKEGMVNLVGIVLLFGLMFIVMFNDIRKLFI